MRLFKWLESQSIIDGISNSSLKSIMSHEDESTTAECKAEGIIVLHDDNNFARDGKIIGCAGYYFTSDINGKKIKLTPGINGFIRCMRTRAALGLLKDPSQKDKCLHCFLECLNDKKIFPVTKKKKTC